MLLYSLIIIFCIITFIGFLASSYIKSELIVFIPMGITITLIALMVILQDRPVIGEPIKISKYEIASINIGKFNGGVISFFDEHNNINKTYISLEDIQILENGETSYIQFLLYAHKKSHLWDVSKFRLQKYTLFITKQDYKKAVNKETL